MKKRMGMKLISAACVCILCTGMTLIASAGTGGACKHQNTKWFGETVDYKTGSHSVTLQASQGPQTCNYSKWVERTSLLCTDCGYAIGGDTYYHEKHSLCGIDY
ncbi:MAG: hypothetical protein HFH80_00520 [Lachnospiraceae bacterium]|nr:hypothetical protein [Lachnospiraceae bacterium]